MSTIADVSEHSLIARIKSQLAAAPPWLIVGIGDDGAVVEHERNHLDVLTVDALVDGVHFDRTFTPPDAIGHRALAANLSDLAAMGAKPRLALLSMALPPTLPLADFDQIVAALAGLAATHQMHVVGGNLTRTPGPLMVDITAMGTARRRHVLRRAGARPGDELYVTGTVGSAKAGLQRLKDGLSPSDAPLDHCVRSYLYPTPRVRTGMLVARNRAASACMDLSDGLADAVHQVTQASQIGATLTPESFPIEAGARDWFLARGLDPRHEALHGGDDYELLFAVARRARRAFHAAARLSGVPVTRVGVCVPEPGVRLEGQAGVVDVAAGFRHFQ
ncbi:MAG: thiamine-phosphate kinase [Vicinamibacterales bacterium]